MTKFYRTKSNLIKEINKDAIEQKIYSAVQRDIKNRKELQIQYANLAAEMTELMMINRLYQDFFESINRNIKRLDDLENIISPGGRKKDEEVAQVAFAECKKWMAVKNGELPSGAKLSELIDRILVKKWGYRENNKPYLSERQSRIFINYIKSNLPVKNWQELFKLYLNS